MIRLIEGDCLEKMKYIPDDSVDLVLADPPFGTTQNKWDTIIPLDPMWVHLKRIIKPKGVIVLKAQQPFTTELISSNYEMFKYCWYWEKSQAVGHLNSYKMPMRNVEDICVFYKQLPTYNPILKDKPLYNIRRTKDKKREKSKCYGEHSKPSVRAIPDNKMLPTQTLKFNNSQGNLHPNQSPESLMEYLISTYTNVGDLIMDFCMGVGTVGVSAVKLKRNFIGMEKDSKDPDEPKYFKIAKKRIESADAQITF